MEIKPNTSQKKVLVGMSGGVDSSVTACLLKEQGFQVIGIHLRFWTDPTVFSADESDRFPQNKCCTLEGLTRTRALAEKLGIPFYVLNFEDAFRDKVVDYFIEGYREGKTPNPCIECNRNIKFGLFLEKMKELGADYVATGHYARKVTIKESDGSERFELWSAKDRLKDQSYFLYTLTQKKLKHILFPVGEYTKPEIRDLAKKFGIGEINKQKESQNLCFFPEETHGPFLQRYLRKESFVKGPIATADGKVLGEHQGLPLYTIGQRKGLGIGGVRGEMEKSPWFVVRIDREKNTLVVGKSDDLMKRGLTVENMSFVGGDAPEGKLRGKVKIRSRFPAQEATMQIDPVNASRGQIEFARPQRAITPGQSAVVYDGEKVLGGGIIV